MTTRVINQVTVRLQNRLDREMSAIRKIERAVNADYVGKTATEIATGKTGVISELTWESSVWNTQTRSSGAWMVSVKVEGYGHIHLTPEYLAIV